MSHGKYARLKVILEGKFPIVPFNVIIIIIVKYGHVQCLSDMLEYDYDFTHDFTFV